MVAFVWLQEFLEYLGFSVKLRWAAPAIAVVVILIALQLVSRKRWGFSMRDMFPMAVECVLLAVPLIVLSLFMNTSQPPPADAERFAGNMPVVQQAAAVSSLSAEVQGNGSAVTKGRSVLADIVTSIGAGIYEELIFRLILI